MRHAGKFLGKRQASSYRGNAPLDAIAEKPLGADMLTTSPPTTHASLLPHELCNEALNIVGPGEVVPWQRWLLNRRSPSCRAAATATPDHSRPIQVCTVP